MGFFSNLFGAKQEEPQPEPQAPKVQKYHCVRFMTERGEQLGMLLTHEEFDAAVQRWVQNVSTMPIGEDVEREGTL
jgi:hypothetical protein